jgi:formaldehyde-activating enzyme involved in methanogenesis
VSDSALHPPPNTEVATSPHVEGPIGNAIAEAISQAIEAGIASIRQDIKDRLDIIMANGVDTDITPGAVTRVHWSVKRS